MLHWCLALAGAIGLPYGAAFLVEGAVGVGQDLGVGDQVISSVFIAVGTSLPELAASITAAIRRHPEIALGNVLALCQFGTLPADLTKKNMEMFAEHVMPALQASHVEQPEMVAAE